MDLEQPPRDDVKSRAVVKDGGGWRNVACLILSILTAIISLILLVLSFAQVSAHVTNKQGNSIFNIKDACTGSAVLQTLRPFRFYFQSDTTNTMYSCPWLPNNSFVRIGLSLSGLLITLLCIRGLTRRRKLIVWPCIIGMFLLGLLSFYAMVIDANSVRVSYGECKKKFPEMPWSNNPGQDLSTLQCAYDPYAASTLLDVALLVLFCILIIFIFFTQRRWAPYEAQRMDRQEEAESLLGGTKVSTHNFNTDPEPFAAVPPIKSSAPSTSTSSNPSWNNPPPPSEALLANPFDSLEEKMIVNTVKWAVDNPEKAKRVVHKVSEAGENPFVQSSLQSVFGTHQ